MKRLTLVYAYYNNPQMLAKQYAHWETFSAETRSFVDIVVVDDGSQQKAVDVPRPDNLPLEIYRVHEDMPWHQNGARNLGAKVARGDWLLLTDMDHLVPEATIWKLREVAKPGRVYRFRRLDAANGKPTLDRHGHEKPHPNTWGISRKEYWDVGGYDERTCGYYGTDSFFREKLLRAGKQFVLVKSPVYRYTLDDVPDANTTTLPRKEGRKEGWREALAARMRAAPAPEPCKFHWYKEFPE